jgi:hypothetical protein
MGMAVSAFHIAGLANRSAGQELGGAEDAERANRPSLVGTEVVVRAVATIQMTLSANRNCTHHCTPPSTGSQPATSWPADQALG